MSPSTFTALMMLRNRPSLLGSKSRRIASPSLGVVLCLGAAIAFGAETAFGAEAAEGAETPAKVVKRAAKAKVGGTSEPRVTLVRSMPTSLWRLWTSAGIGQKEAELISVSADQIEVRDRNAKSTSARIEMLTPEDRDFVQKAARLLPAAAVPAALSAAQVDALVQAGLEKAGLKSNPRTTEEQFVRRIYLDVAGRIPTAAEMQVYLRDESPAKRARLIDDLLNSDGYNSQMFNWLGDMLRLKDDFGKGVPSFVYQEWIKERLAANAHWDTFVYELLTAEGRISSTGPVGYLLRDRGMPLDNLSNTLTTFLGANVACAQCHDHPMAEWTQRNFYEMAAFFGATLQLNDNKAPLKVSRGILDKKMARQILGPNMAKVDTIAENALKFPADYAYKDAAPGDPVHPQLISWSRDQAVTNAPPRGGSENPATMRDEFAVWMTSADNPRFARAIANRIWKKLFGIGVQEPISDLDDPNQASNPALLKLLAEEMKRVHFDLREFQRIVLNTAAYQAQASVTPDLEAGPYLFPGPVLRRMSAEQAWDSIVTLSIGAELDRYKLSRAAAVRKMDIPEDPPSAAAMRAKAAMVENEKSRRGDRDVYTGGTPPRLGRLTLARASEIQQPAKESHFLRHFGQSDRMIADANSVEGGVPQALLMMNGDVQSIVTGHKSALMQETMAHSNPRKQIAHLYLCFFGRSASEAEISEMERKLKEDVAIGDLAWAFLNTREFIFIQ